MVRVETGFAACVREHTPGLLRTAYLLTGNALATEESVDDTLVRLSPKWERVEAVNVPVAYVRRSLANAYVNQRLRASRRELAVSDVPERPDEHDAVTQLGDHDTAAALGCRAGTVRSLISRGLSAPRGQLTGSLT